MQLACLSACFLVNYMRCDGAVVHLGERYTGSVKVTGSNPVGSSLGNTITNLASSLPIFSFNFLALSVTE